MNAITKNMKYVILEGVQTVTRLFIVGAIANCTNLKSFTVVDQSLGMVYSNAFENCTGLTELHLYADSLSSLDATAFNGWTAEQTIYIHGLENLEAAAMKYGKWINTCTVTIVVLPE